MANTNNSLMAVSHNIVAPIMQRIPEMLKSEELLEFGGYSAVSAIKSAELTLPNMTDSYGNKLLEICTPISVQNALLNMLKSYADVSKGQCYFIPYNNKKTGEKELQMQLSKDGWAMLAKLFDPSIINITANVVWKGEDFKEKILPNGKHVLVEHSTNPFGSHTVNDIVGAYCVIERTDGTAYIEALCSFDEIKKAWGQSTAKPIDEKGNVKDTSVHFKFPREMAEKTVSSKACRPIVKRAANGNTYAKQAIKVSFDEDEKNVKSEIEANLSQGDVVDIPDEIEEVEVIESNVVTAEPVAEEAPKKASKKAAGTEVASEPDPTDEFAGIDNPFNNI